MIAALLDWISKEIARHDRMVSETEWTVDAEIYNYAAHLLRRVRDKVKELVKEKGG